MESNGLFDRGGNDGNILAIEVIRSTWYKSFLVRI